MVDEVKYVVATCVKEVSCADPKADSCCPPVDCSADRHADALSTSEEVYLYLLTIGERLRQHVAEVSHRYDLTPQQAMVLDRLAVRRTMGQLADDLACDRSNVTGLIQRLEQRGLVAREGDETDRRTKWLSLTPAGRELRDVFRRDIFQGTDVLSGLGEDEPRQILGALRVIMANLGARPPGE